MLSSPDLVHWQDRGFCFHKTDTSWAARISGAVRGREGSFLLFVLQLDGKGRRWLEDQSSNLRRQIRFSARSLYRSQSAALDIGKATIDAEAFIDDDGHAYLCSRLDCSENKISELYVVPLSDDLTQVTGSPIFCTRPDTPWEGDTWNEAPSCSSTRTRTS